MFCCYSFFFALSDLSLFYLLIIEKNNIYCNFQERERAAETNSIDPIHPNFAATTESYHRAFTETLENAKNNNNNKIHVFVASHNENTVRFALKTYVSNANKK